MQEEMHLESAAWCHGVHGRACGLPLRRAYGCSSRGPHANYHRLHCSPSFREATADTRHLPPGGTFPVKVHVSNSNKMYDFRFSGEYF